MRTWFLWLTLNCSLLWQLNYKISYRFQVEMQCALLYGSLASGKKSINNGAYNRLKRTWKEVREGINLSALPCSTLYAWYVNMINSKVEAEFQISFIFSHIDPRPGDPVCRSPVKDWPSFNQGLYDQLYH